MLVGVAVPAEAVAGCKVGEDPTPWSSRATRCVEMGLWRAFTSDCADNTRAHENTTTHKHLRAWQSLSKAEGHKSLN